MCVGRAQVAVHRSPCINTAAWNLVVSSHQRDTFPSNRQQDANCQQPITYKPNIRADMVAEQHTLHMNMHSAASNVHFYSLHDGFESGYVSQPSSPHETLQMYHHSTTTTSSTSTGTTTTRDYVSITVKSSTNHRCFHPTQHHHEESDNPEESLPSIDSSSRTPQENLKELLQEMEQRSREFEHDREEFALLKRHHHQRLNPELFKDMGYSLRQDHGHANLRHL